MIYVENPKNSKGTEKPSVPVAFLAGIYAVLIIAVVFCAVFATQKAFSQEVYIEQSGNQVYIVGDVTPAMTYALVSLKEPPEQIIITSFGGRWHDALDIIKYVRKHNIDVIAFNFCHSSCAYIWLAGQHQGVVDGSSVTIHLPSYPPTGEINEVMIGQVYWAFGLMGYTHETAYNLVTDIRLTGMSNDEYTAANIPNGTVNLLDFARTNNIDYTVFPDMKFDFNAVDSFLSKEVQQQLKDLEMVPNLSEKE